MTKKEPRSIWIILDPLDGPHLFTGEKSAWKTYKKWKKEAKDKVYDSFWNMSEPIRYDLAPPKPKENMTFREHCAWASKVIKTWPKWKQDVAKSLYISPI